MTIRNERRDAAEHRRLILTTARHLFDQHGVDNVSMHQIAKSAGIGQGTLYRRYCHKPELCFDLMKESFSLFKEEVDTYIEEAKEQPVRVRLEALIHKVFSFLEDNLKWLGVIQRQTLTCSKGQAISFQSPPYLFIHTNIRQLLEEGMEQGVCCRIDANYSAHAILNSISPDLLLHLQLEKGYTIQQLYDSFCKQFIEPLFKNASK
jgi:AcrR family transcriptional regulator